MLDGLGRKVRGMVMLIMLMPVPIILLIIPLLQTNAIQPRYNLEEDVVWDALDGLGRKVSRMVMLTMLMPVLIMLLMMPLQDQSINQYIFQDFYKHIVDMFYV